VNRYFYNFCLGTDEKVSALSIFWWFLRGFHSLLIKEKIDFALNEFNLKSDYLPCSLTHPSQRAWQ
jgi:hypothetical protein